MRLINLPHAATKDDWYTPPWIFEEMGVRFDLDVSSPPGGVPWIPADEFYSEVEDGLAREWYGLVWCNPPFSEPLPWCRKWAAHGNGVILLRADMNSEATRTAFLAADGIFLSAGRIQFVNGHGENTGRVNFSTVLLGRGDGAAALSNIPPGRGHYRTLT